MTTKEVRKYGKLYMKGFSKGLKKSKKYKQDFEDILIEKQKERITNLQEENERLKAELELYKDNHNYLNNKIDKAIEKLKTLMPICIMPNNTLIHGTEKAKTIGETLNILQGSDK